MKKWRRIKHNGTELLFMSTNSTDQAKSPECNYNIILDNRIYIQYMLHFGNLFQKRVAIRTTCDIQSAGFPGNHLNSRSISHSFQDCPGFDLCHLHRDQSSCSCSCARIPVQQASRGRYYII